MSKFINVPVTNEQSQMVPLDGYLLVEQTSTTLTSVYYRGGDVIEITHADVGAGNETMRDEFETAVAAALEGTFHKHLYTLAPTYAVSAIAVQGAGQAVTQVETITVDTTLTAGDNGKIFGIATDALTITLPAVTSALVGTVYTFVNTGADGNNIITISPNSADAIFGNLSSSVGANADATTADGLVAAASGTDDKDWVNTKATANKGDRVTLAALDTTGWFIIDGVGIWASEA